MNTLGNKQKGFTLIELVVVFAIFILVLDISISIFVSLVSQQKGILSEQELLSQTSYVLEHMSTALRDAVVDENGLCLGNGKEGIYVLTHQNSALSEYQGVRFFSLTQGCQEFFLDEKGVLQEVKKEETPKPILSSKFIIKKMSFVINGNTDIDFASQKERIRPRVTFLLEVGFASGNNTVQEKTFQTTISQREFLLP